MTSYFITWKTCMIDGENTEGSFFYETESDLSIKEWIDKQKEWVNIAEKSVPIRAGGDVLITGIFKL